MLFLLCHAGGHRFGIDVHNVVEVLPRVRFQAVVGAPPWLAGLFVHNGRPTPVIDLPFLVSGKACPVVWSSRIVLVSLDPAGWGGASVPPPTNTLQRFGLLMEKVTAEQMAGPPEESGAAGPGLAAWGPVLLHEGSLVQFLELPRLLTMQRQQFLQASAGDYE
jgi:chemotaxis signal transduction protein